MTVWTADPMFRTKSAVSTKSCSEQGDRDRLDVGAPVDSDDVHALGG
jgi:hypothetical protein